MQTRFIPPSSEDFDKLFLGNISKGGGLGDIQIFTPPPQRTRRGGGIFNILSGLARKAAPFLLRTFAPEAINMGKSVLNDVLEGRRIRDSLKERGVEALRGVGKKIVRGGRVRKRKKRVITRNKKRKIKRNISKTCYTGKDEIFNKLSLV